MLETVIFTLYNILYGGSMEVVLKRAATQSQDSDTIAAVTGMLIAAERGLDGLPRELLSRLLTGLLPRRFLLVQKDLELLLENP